MQNNPKVPEELKDLKKFYVPALAVLVGVVGWFWLQSPSETALPEVLATPSVSFSAKSVVTIYISGKVLNPGVIELDVGSRVIDAINAAGGMTIKNPNLNLARILVDGEQIVVENISDQESTSNGKINLNTADQTQLETIPGIGPVIAQRIIDFRNSNGRFQNLSDLDQISGIGPSLLGQLQQMAVVN